MYFPRIYIYKITFEEVPYYYYGVHKEKYFNEEYWGSPVTNKWCWELYTPKKQILQLFDFTDEGWVEAQEVEQRLIKPFYNTDKWCLNECCNAKVSINILRKNGKRNFLNKKGCFSLSKDERIDVSRKAGRKTKEQKKGIHSQSIEQLSEAGKKGGRKNKENKTGFCGRSKEKMSEDGKKATEKARELGVGLYGFTKEQRIENGKKAASQKWRCLVTNHISNAASLTLYQRARGIDKSFRERIE
jgi:hypothetical protein